MLQQSGIGSNDNTATVKKGFHFRRYVSGIYWRAKYDAVSFNHAVEHIAEAITFENTVSFALASETSATRLNINIRQLNKFRFNTDLTQFLKNRFDYDCSIAILTRTTTYAYNFHHFNSFV